MNIENRQIQAFFDDVISDIELPNSDLALLLVTHLLPDRHYFLHALHQLTNNVYIIPKPRSIDRSAYEDISKRFPVLSVTKEQLANPSVAERLLQDLGRKVAILDMGGYFAQAINYLASLDVVMGVVEDTENGHQKYARQIPLDLPVLSVARSPLKDSEDYLVGQSVVFSTESVLREQNVVLNNKNIGVLGYGKIGRSIAHTVSSKNLRTAVYDIDAVKRVQALSHGFASPDKATLLAHSDVLFCATGNGALSEPDYPRLKNGCYISSVTSSDDELDLTAARRHYSAMKISEHVERFEGEENYFYLLNGGNAINFLHNAAVGSFIYLVQSELIAGFQQLSTETVPATGQVEESPPAVRKKLAEKWIKHFSYEG
jgi:adenosylhomocysteinase